MQGQVHKATKVASMNPEQQRKAVKPSVPLQTTEPKSVPAKVSQPKPAPGKVTAPSMVSGKKEPP